MNTEDITIHVYTLCWNEQQMMPHFLRYYSEIAERIVVYDNMSNDSTPAIVRACPKAELRSFETNEELSDVENTRIKNTAYKESRGFADFVIVVDSDEYIYHADLRRLLLDYKRKGITLPRTRGYDMVSWRFPSSSRNLIDSVRLGRDRQHYAKRSIFEPNLEINFSIGGHTCAPVGAVVESANSDIALLHFHYVGLLRCIRRHRIIKSRLGQWHQIRPGSAVQYKWGGSRVVLQFVRTRLKACNVLRSQPSFISMLFAPVYRVRDVLERRRSV